MELLTINKAIPRPLEVNFHEPMVVIGEIKKIVKDLKERNPSLKSYRLMDVGISQDNNCNGSRVKLYFIKGNY